jgi:hypothetical protein
MTIKVTYEVFSTRYFIDKALDKLFTLPAVSFDTETRGVYTADERKEAKAMLKREDLPLDLKCLALLVSCNTGLSFPSLVQVTHFAFGVSDNHSIIGICDNPALEMHIWKRLTEYDGVFLIHNTLFDLKIMYHRIQTFPQNYEDTALLAKCLINDAETWRSKVGLKELMGDYYDPAWQLMDDYEPENLREKKFLDYTAIDGAATYKLWELLQQELGSN